MGVFENVRTLTLTAGAAIAQGRFVKVTTAGEVIQAAAALDDAVGVSLEAAVAQGDVIPVAVIDGAKVSMEAGATVTAGTGVSSDSVGRAVNVTATLTDLQHGYFLEGGAVGEFVTVLLTKKAANNAIT